MKQPRAFANLDQQAAKLQKFMRKRWPGLDVRVIVVPPDGMTVAMNKEHPDATAANEWLFKAMAMSGAELDKFTV